MDIHRSNIKDFILPKINSVFVVDYYLTIQSVFDSCEDFQYEDILANPRIRTQNEIVWATEVFLAKPVLLCNLKDKDKDFYSDLLIRAIHSIEELRLSIKENLDDRALSDLLEKVLSYIDDTSVYCGDGKIVIANWGMIPRETNIPHNTICRKGQLVGKYSKSADKQKTDIKDAPVCAAESMMKEVDSTVCGISTDICTEEAMDISEDSAPLTDGCALSDSPKVSVYEKLSDTKAGTYETETNTHIDTRSTEDSNRKNKSKWFMNFGKILAIMSLLMFLLFLSKDCQGPINIINPFFNPLPAVPTIEPIVDEFVGESADGMNIIATDRLNIYLDQKGNKKTMLKWARAFKRAYPGKEYEISFYDRELDFLQIMVPSSERDYIKTSLPEKLSGFSFEVYDESVYGSDSSMTDPMMNDPNASWYFAPIDAEGAWAVSTGNPDVIIAVVDNGFDSSHPEFEGRIFETYNVLTHDSSVWPIVTEDGVSAHGTHVAATVAGNCNNGTGISGIAPECRLLLVQVGSDSRSGMMSSTAIREGIKYSISNGADVVNISLGQTLSSYEANLSEARQLNYIDNSYRQEEAMWQKLSAMAEERKCVLVFSAGNNDVISGMDPKKRNNSTIIVSALDQSLNKASFSNYGIYPHLGREYSTVSAPGVNIYSATPNASYDYKDGTSMAAPIVSGSVALLKCLDRSLNSYQIINILKETGVPVGEDIGPMINIGKAMHMLNGDSTYKRFDCRSISKEIKYLRKQLDSLMNLCPEASEPEDTLKYDDAIRDPSSLDGLWMVTTSLVSTLDQSPVEIYMEFKSQEGKLILINKEREYSAPLKVEVAGTSIFIKQLSDARSDDGHTFIAYDYSCSADRNGNLFCTAISGGVDKFEFNLVRV